MALEQHRGALVPVVPQVVDPLLLPRERVLEPVARRLRRVVALPLWRLRLPRVGRGPRPRDRAERRRQQGLVEDLVDSLHDVRPGQLAALLEHGRDTEVMREVAVHEPRPHFRGREGPLPRARVVDVVPAARGARVALPH